MKQPTFRDNQFPFIQDLQEQNEILRDKVKHLESFVRFLDSEGNGNLITYSTFPNPPSFETHNHITKRNQNGNLITYSTK